VIFAAQPADALRRQPAGEGLVFANRLV
jgi:hypothetical protein